MWFKVDDGFPSHPKVLALLAMGQVGRESLGLWCLAGAWCGSQLSDGRVPVSLVKAYGFAQRHTAALVNVGLWDEIQGVRETYTFHGWSEYQPARATVLGIRSDLHEKRAAAGRLGGLARARHEESKPAASARQMPSKTQANPSPDPDPEKRKNSATSSSREDDRRALTWKTPIKVFSEERDRAGKGRYEVDSPDRPIAEKALRWAMTEEPRRPLRALRMAARAYVRFGGDWEREAGYPFRAWATDAGKWYAVGTEQAKRNGSRTPAVPVDDRRAPPAEIQHEVGKILTALRGGPS